MEAAESSKAEARSVQTATVAPTPAPDATQSGTPTPPLKAPIVEINELSLELEKLRGTRVLTLLLPLDAAMGPQVVSDIYDTLLNSYSGTQKLDVIVGSGGGDVDAAYGLAYILRRFAPEQLTFIVPRWAKSAATLLVCAGDAILMGPPAELGPLDPQIEDPALGGGQFSPLSIQSTLNVLKELAAEGRIDLCGVLTEKVLPLSLGEYLKSLDIAEDYVFRLLTSRMFKGEPECDHRAKTVATKLSRGYTHHGHFISSGEATSMGLKVAEPTDPEWRLIWRMWRIYERSEMERMLKAAQEEHDRVAHPHLKRGPSRERGAGETTHPGAMSRLSSN